MKIKLLGCFIVLGISITLRGQEINKNCHVIGSFGKHSGASSISKTELESVNGLTAINTCNNADSLIIILYNLTTSINKQTIFFSGESSFKKEVKTALKNVTTNTKLYFDNIRVKNLKTGKIYTCEGITLTVK